MSIIYTNQRSKKRKVPKKQAEQYQAWLDSLPKTLRGIPSKTKVTILQEPKLIHREVPNIPSKDSGYYDTYKKPDKFYTGDKMKGIGTLHKSNAVPIFTDEEAKDQASMRR